MISVNLGITPVIFEFTIAGYTVAFAFGQTAEPECEDLTSCASEISDPVGFGLGGES